MANYVSALSSQGSIGYLETAYAIQHNFPVASLKNASGSAVQPTSVNDATALEKAVLFADLTQDLSNVYSNPLPNAYPVSAYSYLVAPCSPSLAASQPVTPRFSCAGPQGTSPMSPDRGAELGQFINFLACAGQEKMALLGYSPLPPNLVQEDFNAIGRLNGGKQPPPPTAANCRNPYVDGETVLPGEPQVNTSVGDANAAGAQQVAQQAAAQTAAAKAQAAAAAAAAAKAQAAKANGTGGTGTAGHGSGPGTGTSGPGGVGGATQTGRSAGDPFLRFEALKQVAAHTGPPPLLGPVLLWSALLAVALFGPSFGRRWWRRRQRRGSDPAVATVSQFPGGDR